MPEADSLPDPIGYARGLSQAELLEYSDIYGAESREWIIAQRELNRRAFPLWARVTYRAVVVAAVGALIYRFAF